MHTCVWSPTRLPALLITTVVCRAGAGNTPAIRKYSKKASRVVYELKSCPTTSNAPFAVRYMFNYKLNDFSPATCTKAVDLQGKITTALGELGTAGGPLATQGC